MSVFPSSVSSDERSYRIEEVAERTGLTRRTLRYYEEIGLLDPTARTEGNYRLYSDADITRLEQIRQVKETLGISLKEIMQIIQATNEVAALRETLQTEDDREARLAALDRAATLIRQQIDLVSSKMASLTQLNEKLGERLARYEQFRKEVAVMDEVGKVGETTQDARE